MKTMTVLAAVYFLGYVAVLGLIGYAVIHYAIKFW